MLLSSSGKSERRGERLIAITITELLLMVLFVFVLILAQKVYECDTYEDALQEIAGNKTITVKFVREFIENYEQLKEFLNQRGLKSVLDVPEYFSRLDVVNEANKETRRNALRAFRNENAALKKQVTGLRESAEELGFSLQDDKIDTSESVIRKGRNQPDCWVTINDMPHPLFTVEVYTDHYILRKLPRKELLINDSDEDLSMLPYGKSLSYNDFNSIATPIYKRSVQNSCRQYAVRVDKMGGKTFKEVADRQSGLVSRRFYLSNGKY